MRASTTVIAAATSSGLISGTLTAVAVHLRLGISLGPHEQFELIALIVVQVIVALGTALVLAVVLAAARSQSTLASAAIVPAVLLLVASNRSAHLSDPVVQPSQWHRVGRSDNAH
jgi:hypothetical protein